MVGVPRSKGCLLCIKRRVKCDQERPVCGNCVRYGAECPGYDRDHKFVSNKHQVRPRRLHGSGPSASSSERDSPPNTVVVFTGPENSQPNKDVTVAPMLATPTLQRRQEIHHLLDAAYLGQNRDAMSFLSPWLDGVKDRVGAKVTLDSAMSSLILHILGKSQNNHQLVGESLSLYGRSLGALQAALNHKSEWKTTETLCATTILCLFEMFAGTVGAVSWMKHASAVAWLIQQRGPGAYGANTDQAILKNFRPIIIMNSFFSGQDCFLAEPKWQQVFDKIAARDGSDPVAGEMRLLGHHYFSILAKIPGIMRLIFPLHEARVHGLPSPVDACSAAPQAIAIENVYQDLVAWSVRLQKMVPGPTDIPSQSVGSPWRTILSFDNVWFGSLYMGYWTTKLILQEALYLLHGKNDFGEGTELLTNRVLRSVESVGEGVMGPFRIGYGIRVAYDFSDTPTRAWIKSQLKDYAKIYASLDEDSFVALDEHSPR